MAYDRANRDYGRRGYGRPRDEYRNDVDYGGRDRAPSGRGEYGSPTGYEYDERDFLHRAGDEFRSWFGDEEAERRRRYDEMMDRRANRDRVGGYYAGGADTNYGRPSGRYDTDGGFGMANMGKPVPEYGNGPTYGRHHSESDRHAEGYAAWRNRQLAEYDRDYHEYRREHQDQFDREFGQWRDKRTQQRSAVGTAQEHQEVVGSDGEHVGKVDHVRGERIILTKSDRDAGGHHHSIPSSWVESVDEKVTLNRTADQAHNEWRDIERRKALFEDDYENGPHMLNRSFSGTYKD